MKKSELRQRIKSVLKEVGYYEKVKVSLHRTKDNRVVFHDMGELELRAFMVLIHDEKVCHEDYYLVEDFKGEKTRLRFNPTGTIYDEFRSNYLKYANELLFHIL